jgi:hypothetical protein
MGYDELNARRVGRLAVTAVLLGLGLGLAMPSGPVAAAAPAGSTASRASDALPSEAAQTDGAIVVAGNNKNRNNKNWNNSKNWNNKKVVVVRPYRKWYKRPYYGAVVGGVVLGTIVGAAAYSAVPPAPNTCWYWADPAQTQGYWDYCQ